MVLADALVQDWESLTVTQGRLRGEKLTVLDWEREFAEMVAEFSKVGLSMARGNGKSFIASALACSALVPTGALFQERGEIVAVASSMGQARIVFSHVVHFLQDVFEENKKDWRINEHSHQLLIRHRPSGTELKAIGSDPRRAHGLAPTLVLADEPAQWISGGRKMYNALKTALGKQMNAKLVAIGTLPEDEGHWFTELLLSHADSTASMVYAAHKDDPLFNVKTYRKANPSYDHLPDLRQTIEAESKEAEAGGDDLADFKAFRLNMGTPEVTGKELIVSLANWRAVVKDIPPPRKGPVFVGIDLGGGTSMSAVAFYWPVSGLLEAYGAFPAEPGLLERGRKDKVEDRYVRMFKNGELFLYPGRATNNTKFLEEAFTLIEGEQVGDGDAKGYIADSYKENDVKQALLELGKNPDTVVDWRRVGLGPHGGEDVRFFQREVLTGHLGLAQSLIIESAITEAVITRDRNGNATLNKIRHRGRIDVMQASILAVGAGRRWRVPIDTEGERKIGDLWESLMEKGHALVGGV